MTFDPFVVGLVLLAALMHASWNTIIKTGGDGLLMFVLLKAPTIVFSFRQNPGKRDSNKEQCSSELTPTV